MSLQLLLAALLLPCRGQSDCPGKGRAKEDMLKEVTMKKKKPKGMQLMVVCFGFVFFGGEKLWWPGLHI